LNLILENISKKYDNKQTLQNINLQFSNGVYGILGANGSGKTTLMKIITTILRPTTGKIFYNEIDAFKQNDIFRNILGYLPQKVGFYDNFSAEKFLLYMAALKGVPSDIASNQVLEILELVGLEEYKKSKIKTFSGGMKQRVGIAQALLNDPKILIVDEPTAGLDPKERIRFRNLISRIASNRIVLLSTHIVSDIEYIAKEIIIIKKGEVIYKGQSEKMIKEIANKVWKIYVNVDEVEEIQENYKVGNIIDRGDKIELRIISDQKPKDSAIQTTPTLEDVYLYNI